MPYAYRHPQTNPYKGFKRDNNKSVARFLNKDELSLLW